MWKGENTPVFVFTHAKPLLSCNNGKMQYRHVIGAQHIFLNVVNVAISPEPGKQQFVPIA